MKKPTSVRHRIPIRSSLRTSPSSELRAAAIGGERGAVTAREPDASDSSREQGNIRRTGRARIATIEIEFQHPDPATPGPAWTLLWDGEAATVRRVPGSDAGDPADWGIPDASRDEINLWRTEGDAAVIEQLMDNFAGGGAEARIVAVHGSAEVRRRTLGALRAFAEQHPQCAEELRRFALDRAELPGYGPSAESPSSAARGGSVSPARGGPDSPCPSGRGRRYAPTTRGGTHRFQRSE